MEAHAESSTWVPRRGARVAIAENSDGSYSPREVLVVLHSAGMLVERRIAAPDAVRASSFSNELAAADAALDALELDPQRQARLPFRTCDRTRGRRAPSPRR